MEGCWNKEGGEVKVEQGNKYGKEERAIERLQEQKKGGKAESKERSEKVVGDLAEPAVEAAIEYNIAELNDLTKRMAGKNLSNTRSARDKNDKLLSKKSEQMIHQSRR